jgi:DNA-binding LytR/AlgR family response regulator
VARRGPAQFHPLPVARIAQLVSLDKATYALTMDGERYAVEQTLSELETQLDPTRFFRITRQLIVAAQAVRHYSPAGKGRLRLQLATVPGHDVEVSQERAAAFKAWLLQAPA